MYIKQLSFILLVDIDTFNKLVTIKFIKDNKNNKICANSKS